MESRNMYASLAATITLLMIVVVRVVLLYTNTRLASFEDMYYLVRQITYTLTWLMMMEFFLYNYLEQRRIIATHSKLTFATMEWITLGAMVMCVVQALVLFLHHQDNLLDDRNGLLALHNLIEIVAWVVMAIFLLVFFFYHRGHRIDYVSKRNRRAQLLEQMVYREADEAAREDK